MKHFFKLFSLFVFFAASQQNTQGKGYLYNHNTYYGEDYDNGKTLWIHAFGSEEVLSAQGLILELAKQMPNINPFFTTVTVEGKQLSQYFLDGCNLKVIPDDDLETMAYFFKTINPNAIIILEHEVSPSLVLLARLHNVPIYLLNASLSKKTERLLHTVNYLYQPLFNSFDMIFTEQEHSKKALNSIGVTKPQIIQTGPIHTCNIVGKKESYLQLLNTNLDEVARCFNYPIILAHSHDKKDIDLYVNLFDKIKKQHPNLKMILAAGHALGWRENIVHNINQKGFKCYIWDYQEPMSLGSSINNKIKNLIHKVESIFQKQDIMLSCIDSMLYFWHGFAHLYIVDEDLAFNESHNIAEASVWKSPTIVGPVHSTRSASNKQATPHNNIVITAENKQELYDQTTRLLFSEELRKTVGQEAFDWVRRQSQLVIHALQPFFSHLHKNLESEGRVN